MPKEAKYKPEYASIAKKMCELGAIDTEIQEALGIVSSTFYKWRHDYPEFAKALKIGKEAADDRVERALYNKAIGYTTEDVKIFQHQGEPVVVPYVRVVDPDTASAIFWLRNRRSQQWRANPEPDGGETKVIHVMPVPTAASAEEWEKASKEVHESNLQNSD